MERPTKGTKVRVKKSHPQNLPMTRDTPLMQPMSEWDKQDRRSANQGPTITFYPTTKYSDNYDLIDWSK